MTALGILGLLALFILAGTYQWARIAFASILLIGLSALMVASVLL